MIQFQEITTQNKSGEIIVGRSKETANIVSQGKDGCLLHESSCCFYCDVYRSDLCKDHLTPAKIQELRGKITSVLTSTPQADQSFTSGELKEIRKVLHLMHMRCMEREEENDLLEALPDVPPGSDYRKVATVMQKKEKILHTISEREADYEISIRRSFGMKITEDDMALLVEKVKAIVQYEIHIPEDLEVYGQHWIAKYTVI